MAKQSKQKSPEASRVEMVREKLLGKVVFGWHWVQLQWATCMHRHSERLSRKGKLLILACFTLLGSIYCCLLIRKGLIYKETDQANLPEIQNTVRINPDITSLLPKQEVLRVLQFKQYLDSLSNSAQGDRYYDDLIRRRPGLMDSLTAFERLYGEPKP